MGAPLQIQLLLAMVVPAIARKYFRFYSFREYGIARLFAYLLEHFPEIVLWSALVDVEFKLVAICVLDYVR